MHSNDDGDLVVAQKATEMSPYHLTTQQGAADGHASSSHVYQTQSLVTCQGPFQTRQQAISQLVAVDFMLPDLGELPASARDLSALHGGSMSAAAAAVAAATGGGTGPVPVLSAPFSVAAASPLLSPGRNTRPPSSPSAASSAPAATK